MNAQYAWEWESSEIEASLIWAQLWSKEPLHRPGWKGFLLPMRKGQRRQGNRPRIVSYSNRSALSSTSTLIKGTKTFLWKSPVTRPRVYLWGSRDSQSNCRTSTVVSIIPFNGHCFPTKKKLALSVIILISGVMVVTIVTLHSRQQYYEVETMNYSTTTAIKATVREAWPELQHFAIAVLAVAPAEPADYERTADYSGAHWTFKRRCCQRRTAGLSMGARQTEEAIPI